MPKKLESGKKALFTLEDLRKDLGMEIKQLNTRVGKKVTLK